MKIPPRRDGPPKNLAQSGESPVQFVNAWVIRGRVISCSRCHGVTFFKKKIMMNTRGLTFLEMEWLNEEASVLICDNCTRIEWFAEEPHQEPVPATSLVRPQD